MDFDRLIKLNEKSCLAMKGLKTVYASADKNTEVLLESTSGFLWLTLRALTSTVLFSYNSMVLHGQLLEISPKSAIIVIYFNLNLANSTNFYSLEVVDRSSETQLQLSKNFNLLAQEIKGLKGTYNTAL